MEKCQLYEFVASAFKELNSMIMGVFGEVVKSYFESSTPNSSNSTSWEDNFLELVANSSKIAHMFGFF
jgi:hypothetical protein